MKISILTLFPNIINEYTKHSIIKGIIDKDIAQVEVVNFRLYSNDKHQKVDDTIYGGGPGMVLSLQPIVDCLKDIRTPNSKVVLLTPSGKQFNQQTAVRLSKVDHLILICGHYEGFDERILNYVDMEISIGDFVLTGGELAALSIMDSVLRLLPGSINEASLESESFNDGLLDYPVYTKPQDYDGYKVPEILLSGDHDKISKYRQEQRIIKTKVKRPDLYLRYKLTKGNNNESSK